MKMNMLIRKFLVLSFLTVITGCISVDYQGKTFPPTKRVKVYYIKDQIQKPYTVMGTATADTWYPYRKQAMRKNIIEKAKECGADAVLVQEIDLHTRKYIKTSDEYSPGTDQGKGYGVRTSEDIYVNDEDNRSETAGASKVVVKFLKFSK